MGKLEQWLEGEPEAGHPSRATLAGLGYIVIRREDLERLYEGWGTDCPTSSERPGQHIMDYTWDLLHGR